MSKKSLKASEVAEKYKVKPVTVRAWLKRGLFPNARLEENMQGKIWLIPQEDLKTFKKPKRGRPPNKKK